MTTALASGLSRFWSCRQLVLTFVVALLPVLFSTPSYAQASEKFKLALGGYSVYRFDSIIGLTDTDIGLGAVFDPEDALGWDGDQTVFRLDGLYRFNDTHALTFSWYNIGLDGDLVLQRDIDWVDSEGNAIQIPAGTGVASQFDYDIYKLGYLWSFYHNDKVELSVGAGLHMTSVNLNLDEAQTSSGSASRSADTTVPLPVLSFRLGYEMTEKWNWYLQAEMFALSFDSWTGNYSDIQVGVEYRISQHFGAGLGLGSNSLRVREESGGTRFNYDNRLNGAFLFVTGYF